MKIAIDIGHARSTGATGNGLQEHEVCTRLAPLLAQRLQELRHEVAVLDFPGRTNSGDLAETVRAINAGGYDLSVSLHCDSSQKSSSRGAHVICKTQAGKRFAAAVASRLCPLMPGRANHVIMRDDLYVLYATRCPAILVECGFLSNPRDADMLRHELPRIAAAIAAGIAAA